MLHYLEIKMATCCNKLSIFKVSLDTCIDYTRGDCNILAFYLFKLMKDNKIKCSIVNTSSDECDYIHTVILYKNRYIDVLGIHTFDQLYKNHVDMYPVMGKTLFIDKISDAHANLDKYLKYIEEQVDHVCIRDAKRVAQLIFSTLTKPKPVSEIYMV